MDPHLLNQMKISCKIQKLGHQKFMLHSELLQIKYLGPKLSKEA